MNQIPDDKIPPLSQDGTTPSESELGLAVLSMAIAEIIASQKPANREKILSELDKQVKNLTGHHSNPDLSPALLETVRGVSTSVRTLVYNVVAEHRQQDGSHSHPS